MTTDTSGTGASHPAAVTVSKWVNEPCPPWADLLTSHEVAKLTKRHRWTLTALTWVGLFPRKVEFNVLDGTALTLIAGSAGITKFLRPMRNTGDLDAADGLDTGSACVDLRPCSIACFQTGPNHLTAASAVDSPRTQSTAPARTSNDSRNQFPGTRRSDAGWHPRHYAQRHAITCFLSTPRCTTYHIAEQTNPVSPHRGATISSTRTSRRSGVWLGIRRAPVVDQ
jgi:hypothetical protein